MTELKLELQVVPSCKDSDLSLDCDSEQTEMVTATPEEISSTQPI
jgi:hypothetical protein